MKTFRPSRTNRGISTYGLAQVRITTADFGYIRSPGAPPSPPLKPRVTTHVRIWNLAPHAGEPGILRGASTSDAGGWRLVRSRSRTASTRTVPIQALAHPHAYALVNRGMRTGLRGELACSREWHQVVDAD